MKKIKSFIIIALLLAMIVPVSGCGDSSDSEQATEQASIQKSEDELTGREQRLLDRLKSITKEYFFEPSKVRILEIPVYDCGDIYTLQHDPNCDSYGNESNKKTYENEYVVVRLQGENKVGGTLNHYYVICLSELNTIDEINKIRVEASYSKELETREYCSYKLKAGECIELGDTYKTTETVIGDMEIRWGGDDGSKYFDISKINKAFAAYWKDMGVE